MSKDALVGGAEESFVLEVYRCKKAIMQAAAVADIEPFLSYYYGEFAAFKMVVRIY